MTKYNLQVQTAPAGSAWVDAYTGLPIQEDTHSFQQKYIIQDNFENKSFLGFKYKKNVGKLAIPVGLCEICNKLKVEHNA